MSCWKMKNSLQIWRMAGRYCCNSTRLRLMLFTKLAFVIDKYQTGVMSTTCNSPTVVVSDWTLMRRPFWRYVFLLGWWICVQSVVLRVFRYGNCVFSSMNKMMLASLGWVGFRATILKSCMGVHFTQLQTCNESSMCRVQVRVRVLDKRVWVRVRVRVQDTGILKNNVTISWNS